MIDHGVLVASTSLGESTTRYGSIGIFVVLVVLGPHRQHASLANLFASDPSTVIHHGAFHDRQRGQAMLQFPNTKLWHGKKPRLRFKLYLSQVGLSATWIQWVETPGIWDYP